MYEFFYDVILPKFGINNVAIMTGDTDSLCLELRSKDIHKELLEIRDKWLDTSNYPVNHPLHSLQNKGRLGYFKSESIEPISAFIGLRPKCYSILIQSKNICKAKGVGKSAIKHKLRFEHYKKVLFEKNPMLTSFNTIQSRDYELYTVKQHKKSLCPFDNK